MAATSGASWGGIVTPEAVLLELETAGIPSRALAMAIDLFVASFGFLLFAGIVAVASGGNSAVAVIGFVVGAFLAIFAYPALSETWMSGRTLGKAALGLRVVTVEGAPVRFRHAAIRSALLLVDLAVPPLGVVAVISALLGKNDQRLGDRLAGTVVVRTTSGATQAQAIAFPPLPGYEGYVATLDVGTLTPAQYEVLRSFLIRVNTLTPDARVALALRLAGPVAAAMRHTPPPTVHPEIFLACVAAAWQRRHGGPPLPPQFRPPPPSYGPQPGMAR